MVLPRVLTALVFVPLVCTVIWYGTLPFFLFACAISLLSLWEYCLIAEEGGYPNQLVMSLVGGIFLLFALFLDGAPFGPIKRAPGPVFVLMVWSFAVFLREFFRTDKGHSFLRIVTTITGVVILGFFLGHLVLIRELRLSVGEGFQLVGRELTFFLFVVLWTTDTGAWFVGKWIGRFPMAPRLSPKKTWEGALGGTLLACAVGWFFREAFLRNAMGSMEAIFFAAVISVTGQISDLIESLMKRSFGVKDSSQLLPGHGGVLDRFDSFIFSAPFYYYMLIGTGRFQ